MIQIMKMEVKLLGCGCGLNYDSNYEDRNEMKFLLITSFIKMIVSFSFILYIYTLFLFFNSTIYNFCAIFCVILVFVILCFCVFVILCSCSFVILWFCVFMVLWFCVFVICDFVFLWFRDFLILFCDISCFLCILCIFMYFCVL